MSEKDLPAFLKSDRDKDYKIPLYVPAVVRKTFGVSKKERIKAIMEAGYNVFSIPAKYISIDLLTDSGTGIISDMQKSAMELGDESYAGANSFFKLRDTICDILGFEYVLPTHQGRGAEKVIDTVLVAPCVEQEKKNNIHNIITKDKLSEETLESRIFDVLDSKGDYYPDVNIPGNTHFDTTVGNLLFVRGKPVDLTIDEAQSPEIEHPFKGNIDTDKLELFIQKVIEKHGKENLKKHIPYVLLTITCNSGGGQPVSMANIKKTAEITKRYGLLLFFDVARYAENAFFIKEREEGYENKSIKEIIREMFSYADGCYMSSKKDGIVPMGGFIATRHKDLYDKFSTVNILFEGFNTYGGMSGLMMEALAQGLKESATYEYLQDRLQNVRYLGEGLMNVGIPIVKPVGGHAIFIDGRKFYEGVIPENQFPAQALVVYLFIEAGIRAVEIGSFLKGRDPVTGENIRPALDLVRLTIPRRKYNRDHYDVVIKSLKYLYEHRNEAKGMDVIADSEPKDGIRHFTARLKFMG
jgi:tryptophanase